MSIRAFKGASFSRLSKRGDEGEQIAQAGNKSEKTAGTREHKPIFKGNKGPPGTPSKFCVTGNLQLMAHFISKCHIRTLKLLKYVFDCGCPGRKWIATRKI